VTRRGSSVHVTWNGKGTRATSYDVTLHTSAGLDLVQHTGATHATFIHVDRDFGGTISVRPFSRAMIAGHTRTATLHGGPALTLRSTRLSVSKHRDVAVPVSCAGGRCQSVLQLVVRGARGPVRIGLATVRVQAGHVAIVTLHLTAAGRKLLASHKLTTATLVVSTADSTTVTRTVRLVA
jgi:hypothetical protein